MLEARLLLKSGSTLALDRGRDCDATVVSWSLANGFRILREDSAWRWDYEIFCEGHRFRDLEQGEADSKELFRGLPGPTSLSLHRRFLHLFLAIVAGFRMRKFMSFGLNANTNQECPSELAEWRFQNGFQNTTRAREK